MKTLAAFLLGIALLLGGLRAQQWSRGVRQEADARVAAMQQRVASVEERFTGYWPRYERLTAALGAASNDLTRLQEELAAERAVHEPLRGQIRELSAARIAQDVAESELRQSLEAARSDAEQLQGSVADARARQAAVEERCRALEAEVRTLQEGLRGRDSDLTQLRERFDLLTADHNRLWEANKAIAELQNQLAAAKAERDEALAAARARTTPAVPDAGPAPAVPPYP